MANQTNPEIQVDATNLSTLRNLRGVSYAYLNIRSLFRHYDEIKILLERTQLDVLMLGETFLNYAVDDGCDPDTWL